MRPVVGLSLGGPVVVAGTGPRLGAPAWGPPALLRDLELRLGIAPLEEEASVRIPAWVARVRSLADGDAFYARSFALDELGTAARLLEWRDDLVEAGWNGEAIPGGGPRLDALAALERHAEQPHRVAEVERALAQQPDTIYESLSLLEPASLWPGRWRRIFELLERRGTRVATEAPSFGARAARDTDLGRLQRSLAGEAVEQARGDGSVLVLRGDTLADLAEITAMLVASDARPAVVVRCCEGETLDVALRAHGSPAQGKMRESVWRPALQVLALALEIAFEPRDPYRVLELLTLPLGPFRGLLGARLARAVARQPGTGGKEWLRQKREAARHLHEEHARRERETGRGDDEVERLARERVDERLRQVAEWLETPGAPPTGIPREQLLAVIERVRRWHRSRVQAGAGDAFLLAHAQATTFAAAVAADPRPAFTREHVRQLFDRFGRIEQQHELSIEDAGRVAHVIHPGSILGERDRVILWGFVGGVERRPPRCPWTHEEQAAIAAAGVEIVDPAALLEAEAGAWRGAVLAARESLVLVVPRSIRGTATTTHPLWDEIRARLSLDEGSAARLTREATDIRERGMPRVEVRAIAPLALPPGRAAWRLPPEVLRAPTSAPPATASPASVSVTALERIATCPLAWVLEQRAGLRSGAMSKVARGSLLNGGLAHRLVEELHLEGAFTCDEATFLARARERFERLVAAEGATLLLPGAAIERLQLTRQILESVRALHRYLAQSGLLIAAVEEEIATASAIGPLHGRLDLRLVDAEGTAVVLDVKWGASAYRDALEKGHAVQLAVYARAVAETSPASRGPAPAGYFACASGAVLTTDPRMHAPRLLAGPSLDETWRRVEATARAVLDAHAGGVVHVPAAKTKRPLLDALGIQEGERARHLDAAPDAACGYCDYDAICGRKWSAFE
ncbi:MAG: PD-(D/E)XK nuclease family protein [Labilithrix sp.]|nr:PD-(D/E)XK nuclease family protein [Labilithrix sp.]MCW5815790.1 PD-(D/E)XK nuclease family protein [Labilithrix sp.]